jgi:hypothetical protein
MSLRRNKDKIHVQVELKYMCVRVSDTVGHDFEKWVLETQTLSSCSSQLNLDPTS